MYGKLIETQEGYVIPVSGVGNGMQRMVVYLYQNGANILLNDGEDIASVTLPQWLYDAIVEATKKQLALQNGE